ncbi:MAG: T9SS type A sorting domain-containing protein [Janthinobacterium lividum]
MKKPVTLATAAALGLLSLGAQAQATIDGVLNAVEKDGAATTGDYVLLGQYPYAHGFGSAGLLAFYGANTPTKVQLFVAGTIEPSSNNSFQVFIGLSATTGIPTGTALPTPTVKAGGTSFDRFVGGKLDQPVGLAIAMHTNGTNGSATPQYQLEAASYRVGTTAGTYVASDTVISATASPLATTGAVLTLPTITRGNFKALSGARVAYKTTSDGTLAMNPGYVAPLTATGTPPYAYGTATGTTGWEMELDRAALGLATGNPTLNLFVQQNNNDGSYVSSDYMPNPVLPAAGNIGIANPDYTSAAFSGTQSATFALATVALAARVADAAALGLNVYPNPAAGATTVAYQVTESAAPVSIALTDLLGRTVRVLESGVKPVGSQSAVLNTAALAAGTYLVRVQVGDRVSTSKVAVL